MINQLHSLPLSARIRLKILVLVLKSKLGVASKYLRDHIGSPLSATSHRPLSSLDRQILIVQRVSTTMTQTRSFSTIGSSLWNALPLFDQLPTSFSLLKTFVYSRVFALGLLPSVPNCQRRFTIKNHNTKIQYNTSSFWTLTKHCWLIMSPYWVIIFWEFLY